MKHARNRNPAAAVRAAHVVAAVVAVEIVVAVAAKMTIAVIAEALAATRAAAAKKESPTKIIAKSRVSRASLAGNNRIPPEPRDAKSPVTSTPSGDLDDDNFQEAAKGNEAPR